MENKTVLKETALEKAARQKLGIMTYDEYEEKLKEILDKNAAQSNKKSKIYELYNIEQEISKIYNFLNILKSDGSLVLCLALKNDPDNTREIAADMLGIRRKVQLEVIDVLNKNIEELENMFEERFDEINKENHNG